MGCSLSLFLSPSLFLRLLEGHSNPNVHLGSNHRPFPTHLLINLLSWRSGGACPAQVNTAPFNTRGDDGSPRQRCDAAAGRERRDRSGGSRAQLFSSEIVYWDRYAKKSRKQNQVNQLSTFSFFVFCLYDICLCMVHSLLLVIIPLQT